MPTMPDQTLPPLVQFMADNMSYATASQYLPPHTQYYPTPHLQHGHTHVVPPVTRTDPPPQRKRPKYTRSKTGCMTCRVKKIKCDETKPNCMRCTHGQRDCTWPEGIPARKKSVARKDPVDRPPTAGSSAESSTPPTRERTPPRRPTNDINLVPLPPRRPTHEHYVLHPMSTEPDMTRRLSMNNDRSLSSGYPHQPNTQNVLSMIPDPISYPSTQPRYDHTYAHNGHSARHAGFRPLNHEPVSWNTHTEYFTPHDRNLVASHIPNEPHTRYQ